MCARIGLVTGSGLASIIKKKYSKKIVFAIASLILTANTINIGADIGAVAASVKLFLPQLPIVLASLAFATFIALLHDSYVISDTYLTTSHLACWS